MITPAPLFTLAFISHCLPLALSWRLTPLTIDEHPCKPEKLKYQNRYICDSEGEVQCLAGWENDPYAPEDEHFPCSKPICDPECKHGECKLPNVCSCDIGWEGHACDTCLPMPGCVNGGCVDTTADNFTYTPFTCFCDDGWKGALCDMPHCEDHCNKRGKCIAGADGNNTCHCDLGWTGDLCEDCTASVGCNTEHTITELGCQSLNETSNATIDEPNSCQCADGWTGPFCNQPKCLSNSTEEEIKCKHGVCTAGGMDSSTNETIPAFCQCRVGWEGESCDECVPHPMCPNQNDGLIAACILPWECRCEGSETNSTATNDFKICTDFVETGKCKADCDCDGLTCDTDTETCKCKTNSDCPNGLFCDAATGKCKM